MKKSEEKDLLDDIARIGRRVDSIWDGIALFMVIIIEHCMYKRMVT